VKRFWQKIKNVYHLFCSIGAAFWFGFPARKLKVIGVTGTNGKTTTVQLIGRILEMAGNKVAVSSTINFKLGNDERINTTKFTTLSGPAVQRFLFQAVKAQCQYAVLEVSSHALDQSRLWGIDFEVAVITNLTPEHLDYHQTMEEYLKAKLKLFKKAKVAVVNLEMEGAEKFLDCDVEERWGYAVGKDLNLKFQIPNLKFIKAEELEQGKDFSKFKVGGIQFNLKLLGRFNVENALAAICVGRSQDIDWAVINKALSEVEKVSGRLDRVENELNLNILIDYAVTPDSMKKVGELILSMKKPSEKIIWVFGACGRRDQGKRPLMGQAVATVADFAIVTNEDPYDENPREIIDQVFEGLVNGKISTNEFQITKEKIEGKNCWRILDRKKAIEKAINLAQAGDWILITGKGAEETMAISKTKRIDWNDRQVVKDVLASLRVQKG